MATKKIEFTAKNAKAFTGWLKRFASIDNTLLLEIDEANSLFKSKTYNNERSCVKYSEIKFDDAGFIIKPNKDQKLVKVGLFNISRLMKIMDQFTTEFTLTINYDELTSVEVEYAALNLILKNNELKMSVDCSSLNIFNYISDSKFMQVIATIQNSDKVTEFNLTKENIEKVNSLCNLDNDYKFMEFKISESKIYACGKMFELLLTDTDSKKEGNINLFKEQFSNVDVENYKVVMGSDRLVFHSNDSQTITVTSMVNTEE